MRPILLLVAAAFFTALLLAFRYKNNQQDGLPSEIRDQQARQTIIRCSPDWNQLQEWLEDADIPPIEGAGRYHWTISSKNDSARFYFNQGINMYYGFHLIEAMASFKKAARFDPSSAILYWAQALSYGPNINDYGYIASPAALEALGNAQRLAPTANDFEKALIDAMAVRYTADSADATRKQLNADYTARMKKVYEEFPANADAAVLYADAMMLEHPWDLWQTNGTAKAWTPRIRTVLEKVLKQSPQHPGANHYYIHVMEPSPFAALALPSAGRLGITNPGLSHLVHMPSHIYLRIGKYQLGMDVNTAAVKSYQKTLAVFAPAAGADFLYQIHNLHMKTNNAMMAGQYQRSLDAALETKASIPAEYLSIPAPLGNYVQYIHATEQLVYIRFGKWDELIRMPAPVQKGTVTMILHHFGRGFAYARLHQSAEAGRELDQMREYINDSSLQIPMVPFTAWIESAKVAEQLLLGAIHEEKKLLEGAIRHYRAADSIECNMVYDEPRDWLLNPKHFLANTYLKAGKNKEALDILKKDLEVNAENGWALLGRWKALAGRVSTQHESKLKSAWLKAFKDSDIKPEGPAY